MKRNRILNQIGVSFVTCLFILLSSQMAIAATYYIDYVNGLDSNNGTSTSTSWKLCPGMTGFTGSYSHTSGDIFVFKGGVTWTNVSGEVLTMGYSGGVGSEDQYVGGQRCGQTGSPACNEGIVWGTGYPVFDGNKASALMVVSYRSNWVIDGIKFYNVGNPPTDPSGQGLFTVGGSNIEIKNCLFETLSINAFYYGIDSGSSSKIYFHNNYVKRSGRIPIQPGRDAFIDDIQIYDNLFEGPADYDPGAYHTDGLMIGGEGTSTYSITNLKIYRNKWFGDWSRGGTALIYINGNGSYHSTQNTEIYNNVISFENSSWYGGGNSQISPALISIAGRHDNVKIYNNTISGDAIAAYPVGSCITLGYADVSNASIKNNILSGCWAGVTIGSEVTSAITVDYNLYHTTDGTHLIVAQGIARCDTIAGCQASPISQEAHGLSGDPKFVAIPNGTTGSGNWQLQASSPAINKGVDLSASFTTDLLNYTRPTGANTWDIGAYEYGAGNQSTLLVTSVNGTVTSSPSGINCGATCSANYDSGKSVTLTASPNSGYTFTGWSGGGCSGTGTCTVTMNAAISVTASFATTAYNLTVTKPGTGTGTVTGSDALINCGSTCSVNYASGKSVTLAASATSGSTFSGWSGGGCSGTGTCTVTMTAATSVTATFIPVYNLAVKKSVTAAGNVTSNDGTINCGATCSANYNPGKSVTSTASTNSGYTFTGWSGGGCSGTGTCTVTMDAAKSVTASFATTQYNLTVTKSVMLAGTVTGSDGLINCGSTCSVNYASGTSVTLAASGNRNSYFAGWSGACSGRGTCTVSMTAVKSVKAVFLKRR